VIEGTSNWIVLFTVDEFMNNITLSLNTEIIVALLLAVLEMVFDNQDKHVGVKERHKLLKGDRCLIFCTLKKYKVLAVFFG